MKHNEEHEIIGDFELQNGKARVQIIASRSMAEMESMVGKCGQLMKDVERFLHGSVTDSDVQRLSMCGHLAPMVVHPWTYDALATCLPFCRTSQGFTDITFSSRESTRKYRNHQAPMQDWIEAGAWEDMHLLPGNKVHLQRPMRIELMDLVAAFCVDRAYAHLSAQRNVISATVKYDCYQRDFQSMELRNETSAHDARPAALCTRPGYFLRSFSGLLPVRKMIHPQTGKKLGAQKSLSVFSQSCMKAGLLARSLLRAPQELWDQWFTSQDSMALFVSKDDSQLLLR